MLLGISSKKTTKKTTKPNEKQVKPLPKPDLLIMLY